MFGVISLMPIKALAMVELDENGNPVNKEVKEGEVSIMMAPDQGGADQSVSSDDGTYSILSDEDKSDYQTNASDSVTVSPEDDNYQTTGVREDTVKTLSTEGDLATNAIGDKDENVMPVILTSGVVGIALGAVALFLIQKRKKD
jgi:hypothetical protein